jgi:hypothetical protein
VGITPYRLHIWHTELSPVMLRRYHSWTCNQDITALVLPDACFCRDPGIVNLDQLLQDL